VDFFCLKGVFVTLKEARKILGNEANNVSDEELKDDIETAELFKELLFNNLTQDKDKSLL
jgi:hypothetical protein